MSDSSVARQQGGEQFCQRVDGWGMLGGTLKVHLDSKCRHDNQWLGRCLNASAISCIRPGVHPLLLAASSISDPFFIQANQAMERIDGYRR